MYLPGAPGVRQSYISRAAKTLSRLLRHDEEEPNYFGVFKPSVLLTDLSLVQEALADLLEDVAAQQPRPMTHLDQLIASPTARRFWEKHAGEEALACPWLQLSAAFLDEYGPHPDEALDKLQKVGRADRQTPGPHTYTATHLAA